MSEVKPRPLRFLVDEYLPLGKLVLWAGDGGLGKSVMTLDLAACLTTGRPCLGLDYPEGEPCDVLLISCEDDPEDTIAPRLLAAGADLGRVHFLQGVKQAKGKPAPFSLLHYQQLEKTLADNPTIKLVVIDPAGAYIGGTGVDDHKDSELRSLLGPLCDLAARMGVTVLLIKHVTKGVTSKAVQKVSGSSGYINAVRAAYLIAPDPEDKERSFFMPVKNNLVRHPLSLCYRTLGLEETQALDLLDRFDHLTPDDRHRLAQQMFRVEWLDRVDVDPASP
jgi:RecA-family ATPase